jgi:hypothetical protein
MQGANKERWQELCAQAANEQDPEKLSALIAEIDRLLGEKYDRLIKVNQPSLKLTKWLGDIPIHGECSFCLSLETFSTVPAAKPDRADCMEQLERAFARHVGEFHQFLRTGDTGN